MRISYARVLVEIDITQDIPEEIEVNDPYERVFTQQVVFDWKPDYCQTCLSVGHDCKKKLETTTITQQGDGGNGRRRKKKVHKVWVPRPKVEPGQTQEQRPQGEVAQQTIGAQDTQGEVHKEQGGVQPTTIAEVGVGTSSTADNQELPDKIIDDLQMVCIGNSYNAIIGLGNTGNSFVAL